MAKSSASKASTSSKSKGKSKPTGKSTKSAPKPVAKSAVKPVKKLVAKVVKAVKSTAKKLVAKPVAKPTGKSAATSKAKVAKGTTKGKTASKAAPAIKPAPAAKPAPTAKAITAPAAKAPVAVAAVKPVAKPTVGKKPAKGTAAAPKLIPGAIYLQPAVPSKPGTVKAFVPAPASNGTKDDKTKGKLKKKPLPEPAYRPAMQESVPTDGKPRKNQAGLSMRELEHFRDLLLEKRREIVGDLSSMEREALRSGVAGLSSLPVHMADMGTDNYEQEFTLGLVEKDRTLLREINAALGKVQNGTYGVCEGTGQPINKVRLEAQPWTRYSIDHARVLEKQRGLR